jgi:PEP-CTERM motif
MKNVIPALAVAFIATIGAGSAAQAAVHTIDFSVGVLALGGGTLSVTPMGSSLQSSVAFDFDDTKLDVTMVGSDDTTGQFAGNAVSLMPTDIMYGSSMFGPATLGMPVAESWSIGGDMFTETLTDVQSIVRSPDSITVTLTGMVSDMLGMFDSTPARLQLNATETGGPGAAISVSMTNFASDPTVPEPSTWVMMGLGFISLGYAAVRRGKTKTAMLSA